MQQFYGFQQQSQPHHPVVGRQGSSPLTLTLGETLTTRQGNAPLTLTLGEPLHRRLDRSQSEPARIPLNVNSSRYKTELCRPFVENGTCNYGDKCQFAHGAHELRNLPRHPKYKTELCKTFHNTAFCPYGLRCHFVHNADERAVPQLSRPFSNHSSPLSQSPTSSQASFFSEGSLSPSPDSARQSPSPSFSLFAGFSGISLDFRAGV